jgi:hypothetical protein
MPLMALIQRFERLPEGGVAFRTEVDCGWRVGHANGRQILHLETYGSADRERRGKVSQAIEIDEERARELLQVLRTAFPRLE